MAKPTLNPDSLMDYIEEKCVNCKHFEIHEGIMLCHLESFVCKQEPPLYEPLHMKYCKDCFYYRNKIEMCIKNDCTFSPFSKPCKFFKYVYKSYNDKTIPQR